LIVYYKKLENSWYLGLTALKNKYYTQLKEMALIIIILGTVLAAILILILIRIEAANTLSGRAIFQKAADYRNDHARL
jgi:hypothetical protein